MMKPISTAACSAVSFAQSTTWSSHSPAALPATAQPGQLPVGGVEGETDREARPHAAIPSPRRGPPGSQGGGGPGGS